MPRRLPIVLARATVAVLATALALLVAEAAIRKLAPLDELFPQWQWNALPDDAEVAYTTDPSLGYRPVFGEAGGGEYSEFGTVSNKYPATKGDGVTRILFLGDSVTHRWRIQRVLIQRCRESPVEFWNAGVEGFNTGQEVEYYQRWNHKIAPDHVTLVFHNNDFIATPVVFRNDEGKIVVANPRAYLSNTNVALAARSHLYRYYLRGKISRMMKEDPVTSANETRRALATLRDELADQNIGFDVILMPVLKPLDKWTAYENRSRELSLEIFEELEIPFYDLIDPLRVAVDKALELNENPVDVWHPSAPVADRFARYLIRADYLDSAVGADACRPNGTK